MLVQNIKVAADALVFNRYGGDLRVLLVTRRNDPCKGCLAIPGGFVEDDEELEAAAIRELFEETGLRIEQMTQLHTFGAVGRDTRFRCISVVFYAVTDGRPQDVAGGDDAADARWVPVRDIHTLAFDHMEVLRLALEKLQWQP